MCVTGVHVTKELVKPLQLRVVFRFWFTQSVLAKTSRRVARLFQQFRHGQIIVGKNPVAVATNPPVSGMKPSHENAP